MSFGSTLFRRKDSYQLTVEQSTDEDPTRKTMALAKLGDMCRDNKELTLERISQIITIFSVSSSDPNDFVRNNAIWGLSKLADNDIIPDDKIPALVELMMTKDEDTDSDAKNSAVWTILKITEHRKLPFQYIQVLLEKLMTLSKDKHDSVKTNALGTILLLITYYSTEIMPKLRELMEVVISRSSDRCDKVRIHATYTLSGMIQRQQIPKNRLKEAFDLFVSRADDKCAIVKINAMFTLCKYVEMNIIPPGHINQLMDVFLSHLKDNNAAVRMNSISGIQLCVIDGIVPSSKTGYVVDALFSKVNDVLEKLKCLALSTLADISERGDIVTSKIPLILDDITIKVDFESHNGCRHHAIRVLSAFARNRFITTARMATVVEQLILRTSDLYEPAAICAYTALVNVANHSASISQNQLNDMHSLAVRSIQDTKSIVKVWGAILTSALVDRLEFDSVVICKSLEAVSFHVEDDNCEYDCIEAICRLINHMDLDCDTECEAESSAIHAILAAYSLGQTYFKKRIDSRRMIALTALIQKAVDKLLSADKTTLDVNIKMSNSEF